MDKSGDGVDIDTGLSHDEESSKEKLNRPIRKGMDRPE